MVDKPPRTCVQFCRLKTICLILLVANHVMKVFLANDQTRITAERFMTVLSFFHQCCHVLITWCAQLCLFFSLQFLTCLHPPPILNMTQISTALLLVLKRSHRIHPLLPFIHSFANTVLDLAKCFVFAFHCNFSKSIATNKQSSFWDLTNGCTSVQSMWNSEEDFTCTKCLNLEHCTQFDVFVNKTFPSDLCTHHSQQFWSACNAHHSPDLSLTCLLRRVQPCNFSFSWAWWLWQKRWGLTIQRASVSLLEEFWPKQTWLARR